MLRVYAFLICIATFLLPFVGIFSKKIRHFLEERKNVHLELDQAKSRLTKQVIWFHCASLGEFELCKPLIAKCISEIPNLSVALTFFSPSGYQVTKDFGLVDWIGYLPLDTKKNVSKFLNTIKPVVAILVKYEFWPNYLKGLQNKGSKIYAISSHFYLNHFLFSKYGKWLLKLISRCTHIFVQDIESKNLLKHYKIENVSVCGDLRIDRVLENSKNPYSNLVIEAFLSNSPCFVAGSTWHKDHQVLFPQIIDKYSKIIIAPHQISEESLRSLERLLPVTSCRLSKANHNYIDDCQILIIDSIGLLPFLYRFGEVNYVGGGFKPKRGLHNIQEAIVYFNPVIIGPHYNNFPEANELVQLGGCISINDRYQLEDFLTSLNVDLLKKIRAINSKYIETNGGGTNRVFQKIASNFALPY